MLELEGISTNLDKLIIPAGTLTSDTNHHLYTVQITIYDEPFNVSPSVVFASTKNLRENSDSVEEVNKLILDLANKYVTVATVDNAADILGELANVPNSTHIMQNIAEKLTSDSVVGAPPVTISVDGGNGKKTHITGEGIWRRSS